LKRLEISLQKETEEHKSASLQIAALITKLDDSQTDLSQSITIRDTLALRLTRASGGIQGFVRPRPAEGKEDMHKFESDQVVLYGSDKAGKPKELSYLPFDHIFSPNASNFDVWTQIEPIINHVLHPNSDSATDVIIFANGRTGSGKTFTMMSSTTDDYNMSIAPRVIRHVLGHTDKNGEKQHISVRLDITEVYGKEDRPLAQVDSEARFTELEDAIAYLERAASRRVTRSNKSEHGGHEESSRSHLIVSLYCTFPEQSNQNERQRQVHLIDLAGNETPACNTRDKGHAEGTAINIQLTNLAIALQNVVKRNRKPARTYQENPKSPFTGNSLDGDRLVKAFGDLYMKSHKPQIIFIATVLARRDQDSYEQNKKTLNHLADLLCLPIPSALKPPVSDPTARGRSTTPNKGNHSVSVTPSPARQQAGTGQVNAAKNSSVQTPSPGITVKKGGQGGKQPLYS
jgi:hypothetical protein